MPEPMTPTQDFRPPTLGPRRGFSFDWLKMFEHYYAPMRMLGYSAGTFVDMRKDALKSAGKTDEFLQLDKARIAKIEAGVFMGVTALYAARDWKDMLHHFRGAVAAEHGTAPTHISGSEMRRSANPIIQSALRRFTAMNVVRFAADALFYPGLNWGLLGMAGRITAERTLFNQKTAYDRLEILFENTQVHHFDIESKEKVAKDLVNVIQQAQRDHQRAPWSKQTILHYMPFFTRMGEAITDKQIGMTDTVYILGELMTKRLTLEDSLALTERICEEGLNGKPGRVEPVRQSQDVSGSDFMPVDSSFITGKNLASLYKPLTGEAMQRLASRSANSFTDRALQEVNPAELTR